MSLPVRHSINYLQGIFVILTVTGLTLFCEFVGFSLVIPMLFLFVGIHLFLFNKASTGFFLKAGLLLVLLLFAINHSVASGKFSPLYLPVASLALLTMLLFNDLQLMFLLSFVGSAMAALVIAGFAPPPVNLSAMELFCIFFFGCLAAGYGVRETRNRSQLIVAGIYASLLQFVAFFLFRHDRTLLMSKAYYADYVRPLLFSGVISSFIVMATLKIFETLFGVLTSFSLFEMLDARTQPLLKRMSFEAPGTYVHSQNVADLSEAAADAIGANALLTRVGAVYHDIGKIEKAEYFTENQMGGSNKHDNIEPNISRLVILNHVKEGMEMAKKYKLNPLVARFIPEHHGTSLMYFFYQKALEEAEDESSVSEQNYRYPGPKPQIRETAIVLLADSVEGAVRAIDDPNPVRIEDVVRKIINNKFIDGQLDECPLTLKEIEVIAATFSRVLSAIHHGRIKYPEKKNVPANRNRKPAEEPAPQPRPDQDGRAPDSAA